MKNIILSCEVLLFTRLVFHIGVIIWYFVAVINSGDFDLNDEVDSLDDTALYLADRIILIILYTFLQQLKFAQMTIDEDYTCTQ